jgi:hypothetical protein
MDAPDLGLRERCYNFFHKPFLATGCDVGLRKEVLERPYLVGPGNRDFNAEVRQRRPIAGVMQDHAQTL